MKRNHYIIDENTNLEQVFATFQVLPEQETEENVFVLEGLAGDKLLNVLDKIFDFEADWIEKDGSNCFIFSTSIKSLKTEDKMKAILFAIGNADKMVDQWMTLNIYNLIKGYNTFADEYFEAEEIYFDSLVELMDVMGEFKDSKEYAELIRNVSVYYLSIIKTIGITSGNKLEQAIVLPLMYQRLLYMSDFISLSNILNKSKDIKESDLVVVNGSYAFLLELSKRFIISNTFMKTEE